MNIKNGITRIMLALLCACLVAPALGQIDLQHTVQKVERVALDSGEVEVRLVDAERVIPGDELRYTVYFRNDGDRPIDPATIVITDPLPRKTTYIEGTAFGAGTEIRFSVDGGQTFGAPDELTLVQDGVETAARPEDYTTIRWEFSPVLEPGEQSHVAFNVQLR